MAGLPRLLISATHSGAGKTTLTAGLLRALCRCGLVVQPFKAGPDYIDPTYHTLATGRVCRNLDPWLLPEDALRRSLHLAGAGADLAVIEGVMGLFDGYGYESDEGSTARLAKILDAPVVLVIDISGTGRSAAALAAGFARFDPELPLAGFILNRAGGPGHGAGVAGAISRETGLPCFGWLPRDPALVIPERHLGLVPTAEPGRWEAFIDATAQQVAAHLDLKGLLAAAGCLGHAPPIDSVPAPARARAPGAPIIAVARDEAFSFYYEENLELLREAGAELATFSPLRDAALPPDTAGLYLGGGFPEVYAAALAANHPLRRALRAAIDGGLPTYAECGGLMYLTGSIQDTEGQEHEMVGALPGRSAMTGRLIMGYRLATVATSSFLAPAGLALRGHEFHYSDWIDRPELAPPAYHLSARSGEPPHAEGYARDNLLASYLHVHWLSVPEIAGRFVSACRAL